MNCTNKNQQQALMDEIGFCVGQKIETREADQRQCRTLHTII